MRVFLGITGASGAPYAERLLRALAAVDCEIGLTASRSGIEVLATELYSNPLLPREDVLFFADTFHCPYGRRSHTEIQSLAREIVAFLLSSGAKVIVVACNTASAAALHHLRESFDVPIVGMEPAVKPAAEQTGSKVVGVMATEATFQGALFGSLVERFAADVEVLTQTCPGLVERVEAGLVQPHDTVHLNLGDVIGTLNFLDDVVNRTLRFNHRDEIGAAGYGIDEIDLVHAVDPLECFRFSAFFSTVFEIYE